MSDSGNNEEMVCQIIDGIKRLPNFYKQAGSNLYELQRGDKTAIYGNQKDHIYEVFKIKVKRNVKIKGVLLDPYEKLPSNEDFGVSAFSYSDYNLAIKKFTELEAVEDNKI